MQQLGKFAGVQTPESSHRESKKGSGLFPSPASGSVVVLGWHMMASWQLHPL